MIFGKHINRYYLRFLPLILMGLVWLIVVDYLQLEIPALYVLNALFPLYGLAYAQLCAEVVLATAAVIVLLRLFKKLEKQYGEVKET